MRDLVCTAGVQQMTPERVCDQGDIHYHTCVRSSCSAVTIGVFCCCWGAHNVGGVLDVHVSCIGCLQVDAMLDSSQDMSHDHVIPCNLHVC